MPVINRTPYRNLILTGTMGVGKTTIGQRIAAQMDGAAFVDMEIQIQDREGYTPAQIRETFGEARLRQIESDLIEEITLRRSTVIAISGVTLLETINLDRLRETGPLLCLTAALGEILRRLHVMQGGQFHEVRNRSLALGRLKREGQVRSLNLPSLDTTALDIDETIRQATAFWLEQSDI
jgi:shikimate kinase